MQAEQEIDIKKNRVDYVSLCCVFPHVNIDAVLDIFNSNHQNKEASIKQLLEIFGEDPKIAEQKAKEILDKELEQMKTSRENNEKAVIAQKKEQEKLADLGAMLSFQSSLAKKSEFVPKHGIHAKEFVPAHLKQKKEIIEIDHMKSCDLKEQNKEQIKPQAQRRPGLLESYDKVYCQEYDEIMTHRVKSSGKIITETPGEN